MRPARRLRQTVCSAAESRRGWRRQTASVARPTLRAAGAPGGPRAQGPCGRVQWPFGRKPVRRSRRLAAERRVAAGRRCALVRIEVSGRQPAGRRRRGVGPAAHDRRSAWRTRAGGRVSHAELVLRHARAGRLSAVALVSAAEVPHSQLRHGRGTVSGAQDPARRSRVETPHAGGRRRAGPFGQGRAAARVGRTLVPAPLAQAPAQSGLSDRLSAHCARRAQSRRRLAADARSAPGGLPGPRLEHGAPSRRSRCWPTR